MYKIEEKKGLKSARGRPAKYPFADLEGPGWCFLIPAIKRHREMEKRVGRVRAAAAKYARRHEIILKTTRAPEGLYVCREAGLLNLPKSPRG